MSQERTYKQRDNYPTGGFCSKREKCNTFLENGIDACKDCLRYDKFYDIIGENKLGKNIDFFVDIS